MKRRGTRSFAPLPPLRHPLVGGEGPQSIAMARSRSSSTRPAIVALVVGLALLAGAVDAASFLDLGRVFTANMTGNTVLLGIALGQGETDAAWRSVVALLGFGAGVVFGAVLAKRSLRLAFAAEATLVLAVVILWGLAGKVVLVGLAALAMGAQSATVGALGVPGVSTTYVTGTLVTMTSALAAREPPPLVPSLVWFAYLGGAGAVVAVGLV